MARSTTGGMARSNTAWIDPPPYMYTLWMDPMSEKGLNQPPGDMAIDKWLDLPLEKRLDPPPKRWL
jgi:hypothetical protein